MKLIILLSVLVATATQETVRCDLNEIRNKFAMAAEDEKTATSLLEQIRSCNEKSALVTGYMGATEALMGKHAFFPTSKYNWCKKSESDFAAAVKKDPENLEIRYLRLAVEANLPSFLNMSKHIDEDKKKMLQLIQQSSDRSLNRKAAKLLIEKELCNDSEKAQLERYLY